MFIVLCMNVYNKLLIYQPITIDVNQQDLGSHDTLKNDEHTHAPPPRMRRRRRRKRRRKRGGCEKRGREYSRAPVKGKSEQCHDEHTLYDARKRGEDDDGDDYDDDQELFAEFRLLFSRVLPLGGHTRAQGTDDVRKKESERETRRTTALVWWFVCT
ncbi:unnamed protein product [Trichogramma brassicae]|uniref:Uncharacterized protein n=1 Tax=Trichogramma brassicae TaxID=86971 RepID=A0A6H5I4K3_9HYME|nr:unnamed protein product [Trichogramma brassicae]